MQTFVMESIDCDRWCSEHVRMRNLTMRTTGIFTIHSDKKNRHLSFPLAQ
jgi:hypothetical protein